jgi:conjugal transfer/type IV secretion protein DotA/TraY
VQKIQAKQVLGYVLLPGIIPRLKEFGTTGFDYLAFLVAHLYGMVRILPAGHPYLNPANMGRFGIRHAVAEAANRIAFRRENIDQILIFVVSLAAFATIFMMFLALIFGLLFKSAFATAFTGFFATPYPLNDVAFVILDRVFGIPDMFCNGLTGECSHVNPELPWPFHVALHGMFEFYSLAILLFAVLIFLYYFFVVTAETAQSGTPFGKRFNSVFAPLRLVAAIGLLVPVNWGLNSGQYIALYAAKYGSGLATNGWLLFNRAIADEMIDRAQPTGEPSEYLVALPNAPDITPLLSFMSVAQTCRYSYERMYGVTIQPYLVKTGTSNQLVSSGYPLQSAVDFNDGGNIYVRFGLWDSTRYTAEKGNVFPFCGEVVVKIHEIDQQPGAWMMQDFYFQRVLALWEDSELQAFGRRMTEIYAINQDRNPCSVALSPDNPDCGRPPPSTWRQNQINTKQPLFEADLRQAWQDLAQNGAYEIPQELLELGWGGAGIWYNRIAQFNGSFMGVVMDIPAPTRYPSVMEKVLEERRKQDDDVGGYQAFRPNLSDQRAINVSGDARDNKLAEAMYESLDLWMRDDPNQATTNDAASTNIAWKAMSTAMGTYGLMDMRSQDNERVHPLAQLVALGKGLVDGTIRNLGISFFAAVGGGAMKAMGQEIGNGFSAISTMFLSLAMTTMTAGIILYYVLPFLPFIYFFFAVGGWVKTIFEAMVGVPLWALAHLRIDGDGLPGPQALEGYYLIFEIFIRPILCVFGLIAAVAIFAAQARVLNSIFDIVLENLTGFEDDPNTRVLPLLPGVPELDFKRYVIDEFFFTIIYVVLLYMMATASFKLIDLVPKGILRWMGSGAKTFSDFRQDPTGSLTSYMSVAGAQLGEKIGTGIQMAGSGIGQGLGTMGRAMGLGANIGAKKPGG